MRCAKEIGRRCGVEGTKEAKPPIMNAKNRTASTEPIVSATKEDFSDS
jgi:hypothetical protein